MGWRRNDLRIIIPIIKTIYKKPYVMKYKNYKKNSIIVFNANGNLITYLKRKKYVIKMTRFISIVRNYENICRLGHEIINHKKLVSRAACVAPDKLSEEFRKQEERIERFAEEINNANAEWKKNSNSINTYWTGLS